jgi:hypothetical protein
MAVFIMTFLVPQWFQLFFFFAWHEHSLAFWMIRGGGNNARQTNGIVINWHSLHL